MTGVEKASCSVLLQRVIACSVSDQSGGCQNCKASFKWLPGNVHSYTRCIKGAGLGPKHYQRDQWNVMMSLADLDVSKTTKWDPAEVVL